MWNIWWFLCNLAGFRGFIVAEESAMFKQFCYFSCQNSFNCVRVSGLPSLSNLADVLLDLVLVTDWARLIPEPLSCHSFVDLKVCFRSFWCWKVKFLLVLSCLTEAFGFACFTKLWLFGSSWRKPKFSEFELAAAVRSSLLCRPFRWIISSSY